MNTCISFCIDSSNTAHALINKHIVNLLNDAGIFTYSESNYDKPIWERLAELKKELADFHRNAQQMQLNQT
jgi:hypothetical protein